MKNISKKIRLIKRIYILKEFVNATENFINLKLYENLYKSNLSYNSAEKLATLCSFIKGETVDATEFLLSNNEKENGILDNYLLLKNSYKRLKVLGFNKKMSNSIIKKLKKHTLLKYPNYIVSLEYICNVLLNYIMNNIDKKTCEKNIFIITLSGKKNISYYDLRQLINSIEKNIEQR